MSPSHPNVRDLFDRAFDLRPDRVTLVPERREGGAALGGLDARLLRDALRKQIEANELTLDRLHRGVAVFSKDLQLSYFNDAIAQLWEVSPTWLQNHPNLREVLNALRDRNKVPQTRNFATYNPQVARSEIFMLGKRGCGANGKSESIC